MRSSVFCSPHKLTNALALQVEQPRSLTVVACGTSPPVSTCASWRPMGASWSEMRPARQARCNAEVQRRPQTISPPTRTARRGAGGWYPSRTRSSASLLRVGDEPIAVHRHAVDVAQVADGPPRRGRWCPLSRSRSSRIPAAQQAAGRRSGGRSSTARASISFVPPAGRDQPDADLDQTDVRLGRRLNAIRVQGDLRSRRRASGQPARPPPAPSRIGAPTWRPGSARTIKSTSSQLPSCASSSSSIRLAPAEKFTASLPTTSAGSCVRPLPRRLQHLDRVAADRVHLRVELDREDAVAEIDEARARVAADDRLRSFAVRRICRPGAAGRNRIAAKTTGARRGSALPASAAAAHRCQRWNAMRPRLRERRWRPASRTARAPSRNPHCRRAIDIVDAVRDLAASPSAQYTSVGASVARRNAPTAILAEERAS